MVMLLVVAALTVFVVQCARCCSGCGCCKDEHRLAIGDTIIDGSAYTFALSFLATITVAFNLDSGAASKDIGYLAFFTAGMWLLGCVVLTVLGRMDGKLASSTASKTLPSERELDLSFLRERLGIRLRTLTVKAVGFCIAEATYTFAYVVLTSATLEGDDTATTDKPLPVKLAAVFLVVAVLFSVLVGSGVNALLRCCVASLRRPEDGSATDVVFELLQEQSQTTSAAVVQSLAWLVGRALNALVLSALDSAEVLQKCEAEHCEVTIAAVYAVVATLVAALVTLCCACSPPNVKDVEANDLKPNGVEETPAIVVGARSAED